MNNNYLQFWLDDPNSSTAVIKLSNDTVLGIISQDKGYNLSQWIPFDKREDWKVRIFFDGWYRCVTGFNVKEKELLISCMGSLVCPTDYLIECSAEKEKILQYVSENTVETNLAFKAENKNLPT